MQETRNGTLWAAGTGLLAIVVLWAAPPRASATTAADLCAPAADPCVVNTAQTVTNNSIIDVGARELRIASGGSLNVGSGSMTLMAGILTVQAGGALRASGSSSLPAGNITASARSISTAGTIEATGSPGGTVTLTAETGALIVTGPITANFSTGEDVGGDVTLTGVTIEIRAAISTRGGPETLGGSITAEASGDLFIDATLNANGGDGGEVSLSAGTGLQGAGNLTIAAGAQLTADAIISDGFGGCIDFTADGDAVNTGHIQIDGTVSAQGRTGLEDGGTGGLLDISADGDIRGAATANLTVAGGLPGGDGGDIDIAAEFGDIVFAGELDVRCPGTESGGGGLSIDGTRDISLTGSVIGTAGSGGGADVAVESTQGSVMIGGQGIDVRAVGGIGMGGGVCLTAGSSPGQQAASLSVAGPIAASGNGSGRGGNVELIGRDAVNISRAVNAAGGILGSGGMVSATSDDGPVVVEGELIVNGTGANSAGGVVSIDGQTRVTLAAQINARGSGGKGGTVGLSSTGPISVQAPIAVATTGAGLGGLVEVMSEADILVNNAVTADAGAAPGGRVAMTACMITICGPFTSPQCPTPDGLLSALGPSGTNRLTGRGRGQAAQDDAVTVVFGTVRSDSDSGRNELVWDGSDEREPVILGTVTPTERLIPDATLQPCPICGNRAIELPETCDDGNQEDGDGCSATCQSEGSIPGDVNGDRRVDDADVFDLVKEIFDGDRAPDDSVTTVSSPEGRFFGSPGADANDDTRINAADFPAVINLRGGL